MYIKRVYVNKYILSYNIYIYILRIYIYINGTLKNKCYYIGRKLFDHTTKCSVEKMLKL